MRFFLVGTSIAILLFASVGQAQDDTSAARPSIEFYNFDFTGGGARAEGMGKAFLGVSDDVTGGSWNPAGLFVHEKPVVSLSYGTLAPRGSTNSKSPLLQSMTDLDHSGSFSDVTSVNFVAPVRIKGHHFVGSFNYTRNTDEFRSLGLSWTMAELMAPAGQLDTVYSDVNLAEEYQGGLNTVNIGFGTRLYKDVSFGVALNIYTGKAVRDQLATVNADSVPSFLFIGSYYRQLIEQAVIDTNKFTGTNGTVSFKYNGNKVDVGLIARIPLSAFNVKTGRTISLIIKQGNPEVGQPLTVMTDTTFFDDLLAKYKLPLMIGAGVGYRPSENLLLALDAEFRRFSGLKIDMRDKVVLNPGGKNVEYFTEFDPEWNNVFAVRAGAEYLYGTGIGTIPIRAGLGYVPQPGPSFDILGNASTTVVGYTVSLGTGLHWSQIHLDWAYTYTSTNWDFPVSGYAYEDGEPELVMFAIAGLKNRNHHFNFSLTGYF
jgi:hypothetical protein